MRTLAQLRHAGARRGLTAVTAAAAMLLAGAGSAAAVDDDNFGDIPLNCLTRVTGNLNASATAVVSGGPTTLTWNVNAPVGCDEYLSYKFGTSFASAAFVGRTGGVVRNPVTATTFRLYVDFGDHYRQLAARPVSMVGAGPVTVALNAFNALDVQEEGGAANGDEPWLMVFPFFIDGTTVDVNNLPASSARVFSAPRVHGNLNQSGVDDGAAFAIPSDTGRFTTTLEPIRGLSTPVGTAASTAGVAVIAFDEDGASDYVMTKGMEAGRATLKTGIDALVMAGTTSPTPAQIAAIENAVRAAIIEAVRKATFDTFDVGGMLDPDDFIGAQFRFANRAAINLAGPAGIPVTMDFVGNDASYRVTGAIRNGS